MGSTSVPLEHITIQLMGHKNKHCQQKNTDEPCDCKNGNGNVASIEKVIKEFYHLVDGDGLTALVFS